MNKPLFLAFCGLLLLGITLSGCGGGATQPLVTELPTMIVNTPTSASQEVELFAASSQCVTCHSNLKDSKGADFSFVASWQPSIHANASIDPYFTATVRTEVQHYPELQGAIEGICSTCHMGMANLTAKTNSASTNMLDDGLMNPEHPLYPLALEGVSCTLCHQVKADGLGEEASFSGNYKIDTTTAKGGRSLFGVFEVAPDMASLMQSAVGFVPQKGEYMGSAKLCATCHTLFTSPITADGALLTDIQFPEQTPYLEWQASSFTNTPCQKCHMPPLSGSMKISTQASPARNPVYEHIFVGGNQFMLNLINNNRAALNAGAQAEQYQALSQRVQDFMGSRAASLTVKTSKDADMVSITVKVNNMAGHKLPTAFPSRRVWLHVTVTDASGNKVFESGAWNEDGSIAGNDNDADASKFEPHYTTITDPNQVQIYESIIGDLDGKVTTNILAAASYLKDSRIPPTGFDKAGVSVDIGVKGDALTDENFTGGSDEIVYEVPLNGVSGALTVKVEALYQSIGFRWLENFREFDSAEVGALLEFVEGAPNTPLVLAGKEVQVP
jgi:hypothetical protein